MRNKPIDVIDDYAMVAVGEDKATIQLDDYNKLMRTGVSNNWFMCNGYVAVKTKGRIQYIHRLINDSNDKTAWFRTSNTLDLRKENIEMRENVGIKDKMARIARIGAERKHNHELSNWSLRERARLGAFTRGKAERQRARNKAHLNNVAQREGEKRKPMRQFLATVPQWLLSAIPGMEDD